MEVASEKESREKEVEAERMMEEEFNNQCNRFGRLVTFNEQLYIGPLNNELKAFQSMWRYDQQQKKRLEKMLTESYAENRNLRDTIKTLQEKLRSSPGADPATTESTQRSIALHPNPNERAQAREDLFAFFNKNCFVPKSTKESTGSHQPDVAQQSLDPVGHPVDSEQVVTEQILTKSLVFVTYCIFVAFALLFFAISTIALYTSTIAHHSNTYSPTIPIRNILHILVF